MSETVLEYAWLRIATLAVVHAALPVNVLRDMGYPALSFETLAVVGAVGGLGAALGWLTRSSPFYFYLLGLAAYAFVDTNFLNLEISEVYIAYLILFSAILLFRICRDSVLPYLLVFTIIFVAASLLREGPRLLSVTGEALTSDLAPQQSILHIVLDEQGSPFNVAYRPPENHIAARMLDDYESWGFRVHSQVYSQTPFTFFSLSKIMALAPQDQSVQKNETGSEFSYATGSNAYLETLLEQDYSVSVLQSSYIDFCLDLQMIRCETYSRTGHRRSFEYIGTIERFKFAFGAIQGAFHGPHRSGILLYRVVDRLIHGVRPALQSYIPLIAHDLLEESVFETAVAMEPGQIYFVHLIFPHFPYLFDADCQKVSIANIGNPVRHSESASAEDVYLDYWDQVACAHRLIGRIMEQTADKEFLTTIVHGDHGPRIEWLTQNENKDDLQKTFFAVRSAKTNPSQNNSVATLEKLVVEYLRSHLENH